MVVSWNRGTPKSSILMGFFLVNQPFLGTTIYGNPHIYPRVLTQHKPQTFPNSGNNGNQSWHNVTHPRSWALPTIGVNGNECISYLEQVRSARHGSWFPEMPRHGGFHSHGGTQNRWSIMEHPMKMTDLGVPQVQETSTCGIDIAIILTRILMICDERPWAKPGGVKQLHLPVSRPCLNPCFHPVSRGFLKWGYPQSSSILDWAFPL